MKHLQTTQEFHTPTQLAMIREHLEREGSITPLESLRKYSCYRLGDVIFKLRGQGYNIETTYKEGINQFGKPCRVTVYELKGKPNNGGQSNGN